MRVAFGTTVLQRGLARNAVDGIGNYARALSSRLAQRTNLELTSFSFGPVPHRGEADSRTHLDFGAFGPQALYSAACGRAFPTASRRAKAGIDLIHAPDHLIPSVRKVPVIATLMDAIPLAHPEWVSYSLRRAKNALWRRSATWANHIITISEHAKQELIEWFYIPESRISVTPLGVDQRWFCRPDTAALARVNAAYALPEHFMLFVGTLQPRKNLARLIAAHRALPMAERQAFPLVVIGRAGWNCDAETGALDTGDGGALRWLRYVPDQDLVTIVSRATALVFPSLHEGFGLPVLEAFAAGTPVISSNATSLPEVTGEAALLFDPTDSNQMAESMQRLIHNPALAQQLIHAGQLRARTFTWERTADMTETVYRNVLNNRA